MLSKLLKYEFRATGRIMLPVYALLLVSCGGCTLFGSLLDGGYIPVSREHGAVRRPDGVCHPVRRDHLRYAAADPGADGVPVL